MYTELEYKERQSATHTVRLLSPMGLYPSESIIIGDSIAYFGKDISFLLTPLDDVEPDYSEVAWLKLNEVRLLSSMLLSIDDGMLLLHPHPHLHYIRVSNEVSPSDILDLVRSHLFQAIAVPDSYQEIRGNRFLVQTPYNQNSSVDLPVIDEERYRYRDNCINSEVLLKLHAKIDITDKLMMRALVTLLRSSLLMCYSHLLEEAINSTFISLDASFSMVQRRLRASGNPSPSSKDASEFISDIFNTEGSEKYFQCYYESRIMAFHPSSRFGEFAHSPVIADDCYDLFDSLISVYRYLVCDDVRDKSLR
ncbi:TPA: hypothetical protein O4G41_004654 [Vibrio alginolyticus]|nr:hypothetical protein [Vibrio vulnificus]HCZ9047646.1 hypothetical protein [Vibrio alginolyticus]HCZ9302846.1 hypothetical protein [Vibrio alginolyticus]